MASMSHSPYAQPGSIPLGAHGDEYDPYHAPAAPHPQFPQAYAPAHDEPTAYEQSAYLDPGQARYRDSTARPHTPQSFRTATPLPAAGIPLPPPSPASMMMAPPPLHDDYMAPPTATYAPRDTPYLRAYQSRRRRAWWFLLALAAVAIIAVAVVVPVYYLVIKPKNNTNNSSGGGTNQSPASGDETQGGTPATDDDGNKFVIGRDGAVVVLADGTSFTYRNNFGGYFVHDPKNPYNLAAKAQSWTPALNETWDFSFNKVRGVNLGGWLVPEPFIAPQLYQKYLNDTSNKVPIEGDEWTLSLAMGDNLATEMENHYKTFITEQDIAQIAGAGLNFIRLPIPFWAVETWTDLPTPEPFLQKVSWKYVLQAIEWCRKYGIRVNLDLHTVPGAANLWNHSGKGGNVNFLSGAMGYANVQRGLDYIRVITEFVSQPEYSNIVLMFGIVNEPTADLSALRNFYLHAHDVIRSITGIGTGKGPYISIHDQFKGPADWAGFAAGADRMALEQHPYFTFGAGNAPDIAPFIARPCSQWGPALNQSQNGFGVTTAGEWSLGFNDCGLWINGIGNSHQTQDCDPWDDWQNYSADRKAQLMQFASAQMDAFPHWFFWTWKIGPDGESGVPKVPLWSYSLGLQNGWIPPDPRTAEGTCARLGVPIPKAGPYSAWQTGGGSGKFVATTPVWPPVSMPGLDGVAGGWPTYTATKPIVTLPPIADNPKSVSGNDNPYYSTGGSSSVDGWFNAQDTASMVTRVNGCEQGYAEEYEGGTVLPPDNCAALTKRADVEKRTPAPAPSPSPSGLWMRNAPPNPEVVGRADIGGAAGAKRTPAPER